jgi:GH35 family endo-1,4-beta-xylanase
MDWKEFDYTQCDYIYLYAKKNNMMFRGHALLNGNVGRDRYHPDFLEG